MCKTFIKRFHWRKYRSILLRCLWNCLSYNQGNLQFFLGRTTAWKPRALPELKFYHLHKVCSSKDNYYFGNILAQAASSFMDIARVTRRQTKSYWRRIRTTFRHLIFCSWSSWFLFASGIIFILVLSMKSIKFSSLSNFCFFIVSKIRVLKKKKQ